jgi:hypothetical protein
LPRSTRRQEDRAIAEILAFPPGREHIDLRRACNESLAGGSEDPFDQANANNSTFPRPRSRSRTKEASAIHVTGKHGRPRALTAALCDVCGAPLPRGERWRLVWKSGLAGDLVLADLCASCAGEPDRLLAMYGGGGREAVRLTQEGLGSAVEPAAGQLQRVGGMIVRGLVYVLIALAAFLVVTLVTSRA